MENKKMVDKVTLGMIMQELKDFKEDAKEDLKEIKDHAKYTNGKIAQTILDLGNITVLQETCPARNNYKDDKKITRSWIMWIPVVISLLISISMAIKMFI